MFKLISAKELIEQRKVKATPTLTVDGRAVNLDTPTGQRLQNALDKLDLVLTELLPIIDRESSGPVGDLG